MSVCVYGKTTFESRDVEISFLVCVYKLKGIRYRFVYEGRRIKVNATAAKSLKVPMMQCKTLMDNMSDSVEARAVKFTLHYIINYL